MKDKKNDLFYHGGKPADSNCCLYSMAGCLIGAIVIPLPFFAFIWFIFAPSDSDGRDTFGLLLFIPMIALIGGIYGALKAGGVGKKNTDKQ